MAIISTDQREKLGTAFNNVIDMLRLEMRNVMFREHGDIWAEECRDALSDAQRSLWDISIKDGVSPEGCIDLGNVGTIAVKNKAALEVKLGRQTNSIITWFNELRDVRNDWAHNKPISEDSWRNAIETMLKVAKAFKSESLEADLRLLRGEGAPAPAGGGGAAVAEEVRYTGDLKPWFEVVTPHEDIRMGSLDESVFAANLNQVHFGQGREVYSNAELFFQKTYFTAGLSSIAEKVVKSLNGDHAGENRVLSLQTGFGGGKTHSLISLYHIVKLGTKCNSLDGLESLVASAGPIQFDNAKVAVFTNATNDPIQGREVEPGMRVRTIWGEIAYQLGGKAAYEKVRANDEAQTGPKGIMGDLLKDLGPTLILIDELADYCVSASAVKVGDSNLSDQTVSFVQELTESVEKAPQAVLVATLPASVVEVANSEKGAGILTSLQQRFIRVGQDTKPVEGDEIYEVIRRRLFEDVGSEENRKKAMDRYMAYYEQLVFSRELPDMASKQAYRKQMENAFPFHPELIEVFRTRWASNHYFQRTRGVLRMLGSVTADLWKRRELLKGNQAMIHASDLRLVNLPAITNQIRMLNGEGYQAVIDSDVSGNASASSRIDNDVKELGTHEVTNGVAAVAMLASFGADGANQGMSMKELKLAVVRPDTFNHSLINNALDRMEERAHYLHFSTASAEKRYWFHTKPNLNILITEARAEVKTADIHADVLQRLNKLEQRITGFTRVMIGVEDASVVPEFKERALVILGPSHVGSITEPSKKTKQFISKMATQRGDQNRVYRNTMLFLSANDQGYASLQIKVAESLACGRLLEESTNLEDDQRRDLQKRRKEAEEGIDSGLASTFNLVSKHSAAKGVETLALTDIRSTLSVQINSSLPAKLKEEEWLIEGVGYTLLERNNLLPKPGEPISVEAVVNAFIQFDDKPQVESREAVLRSLQNFCVKSRVGLAKGSPGRWENTWLGVTVPQLEASDVWFLIVPKEVQAAAPAAPMNGGAEDPPAAPAPTGPQGEEAGGAVAQDTIRSITVEGNVTVNQYNQLFQSFLVPLNHMQLNPQVSIRISAEPSGGDPLPHNDPRVKAMQEAARQLGVTIIIE